MQVEAARARNLPLADLSSLFRQRWIPRSARAARYNAAEAPTFVSTIVYIALGSNLGDRERNLEAALAALPPDVAPLERSPIYETEPWGFTRQPKFLNAVVRARTSLGPTALLDRLKSIERALGRRPTFRHGPRVIDLDLLLYGDAVLQSDRLTLPHPSLAERAFVLRPLADLDPELRHPVLDKTMAELLDRVDMSGVRPWEPVEPAGVEGAEGSPP